MIQPTVSLIKGNPTHALTSGVDAKTLSGILGHTNASFTLDTYPNTFSAIAPLSGSVKFTDANISKLKNTPVWAIVGEVDKIVDPSSSISFIEELQKINPKAKITVITGADHFAVPTSYLSGEYNIVSWLIEQ